MSRITMAHLRPGLSTRMRAGAPGDGARARRVVPRTIAHQGRRPLPAGGAVESPPPMSDSPVRLVPDAPASTPEVPHLRSDPHALQRSFLAHVQYTRGQGPDRATPWDKFLALAMAVRDRLAERWVATKRTYRSAGRQARLLPLRRVPARPRAGEQPHRHGPLRVGARGARASAGVDLDALLELEPDAGLGNGGLGRLAACFLDSMATLGCPGMGYGIRYEFGIFRQEIIGGHQVERADEWLKFGNPWEIVRPEKAVPVRFDGRVEQHGSGRERRARRALGGREDGARRPLRHADRRLRRRHRQHAAPLAGARLGRVRLRALQRRRLRAQRRGEERLGGHLARSSTRTTRTRPARSCASSRSTSSSPAAIADIVRRYLKTPRGLPRLPGEGGHPAQRHAPGHRHRRADARAGRREAACPGTRRGRSPSRRSATPTTPCSPRRWRSGR